MRIIILTLLAAALALPASAGDPVSQDDPIPGIIKIAGPIEFPQAARGEFYCQPPAPEGYGVPVGSGIDSEVADDIPGELAGHWIHGMEVYVGEADIEISLRDWIDPTSVFVFFYDTQCPPAQEPFLTYEIEWDGPLMEKELVYQDPMVTVYQVILWFCPPVLIEPGMSVGFMVGNCWGAEPPWPIVLITQFGDVYGCGEAYYDSWYFGVPRWTPVSEATGEGPFDVAFCLLENMGPSAADGATWGAVKSLYR